MLAEKNNAVSKEDKKISLWIDQLSIRLDTFCDVAKEYNQALKKAESYLSGYNSSLSGFSEMPNIIREWLSDVCEEANKESSNISHLKITPELLPSLLRNFDFPRSGSINSSDPEVKKDIPFCEAPDFLLKTWVIENFDFNRLKTSIDKAKQEIQSIGFKHCADYLISKFGLRLNGYRHENDMFSIKQQKGCYLLEVSHYGNWVYERVNSLKSFKENVQTFERESDVVGFSYCIQMLINEENALNHIHNRGYDVCVKSRTKVAEDGAVSAQFFKEKIKFAFEPEVFEALISFINEHKSGDIQLKSFEIR